MSQSHFLIPKNSSDGKLYEVKPYCSMNLNLWGKKCCGLISNISVDTEKAKCVFHFCFSLSPREILGGLRVSNFVTYPHFKNNETLDNAFGMGTF